MIIVCADYSFFYNSIILICINIKVKLPLKYFWGRLQTFILIWNIHFRKLFLKLIVLVAILQDLAFIISSFMLMPWDRSKYKQRVVSDPAPWSRNGHATLMPTLSWWLKLRQVGQRGTGVARLLLVHHLHHTPVAPYVLILAHLIIYQVVIIHITSKWKQSKVYDKYWLAAPSLEYFMTF